MKKKLMFTNGPRDNGLLIPLITTFAGAVYQFSVGNMVVITFLLTFFSGIFFALWIESNRFYVEVEDEIEEEYHSTNEERA